MVLEKVEMKGMSRMGSVGGGSTVGSVGVCSPTGPKRETTPPVGERERGEMVSLGATETLEWYRALGVGGEEGSRWGWWHKGPTHFIESVIGQWGSTEGNKPTNEESRYACDEEDAPEGLEKLRRKFQT
ncbi:Adenomatous polyposis coli protein [Dissostichus eleginoides]|uniref:Adenomatous polyposis coli protein n=1 Tax=Dissostichus eleginoides TaxID=100907 RepID=A0AAD9ETL7_DISEL|nr:Adenomatous polyposis coli protein [Dissostichus eleginoides]